MRPAARQPSFWGRSACRTRPTATALTWSSGWKNALGRPEAERYDLAFTIRTAAVGVGITTENEISRFNLEGVVDYTLTERATGARVAGGQVKSFTAYSATGSTVAGLAAEEDAATRLMRILADQIVARLVAVMAAKP
jgi:LPS-assembly lipoprotein